MGTQGQTQQNGQNNFNDIPLKVISIPDKEWKEYRNQAPQDDLLVLGIGMKLWLAKTRKSGLFFALGLLLSVIIGALVAVFAHVIAGVVILALGYLIFCTLCMRRHFIKTSLNQTKSKLTPGNKKALDAQFKTSGGATFAEVIITIILFTLYEPYALAIALISAVIPSLLNTKLVIPEGFGFEALEEIKGYYAEKSFLSDVIDMCVDYNLNSGSGTGSTVIIKDQFGYDVELEEQSYVVGDRYEKVYKDKYGNEYISNDGGKTVRKRG